MCACVACRVWAEHQTRTLGKELSCPLCRAEWGEFKWRPPPAPRRKRREDTHEQAANAAHMGTCCGACRKVRYASFFLHEGASHDRYAQMASVPLHLVSEHSYVLPHASAADLSVHAYPSVSSWRGRSHMCVHVCLCAY